MSQYPYNMAWTVVVPRRVQRQIQALPRTIQPRLVALLRETEIRGPGRGNKPNYGKLSPTRHHCHFKKGRPTYVALWEGIDPSTRLVEVIYAGTHESCDLPEVHELLCAHDG